MRVAEVFGPRAMFSATRFGRGGIFVDGLDGRRVEPIRAGGRALAAGFDGRRNSMRKSAHALTITLSSNTTTAAMDGSASASGQKAS